MKNPILFAAIVCLSICNISSFCYAAEIVYEPIQLNQEVNVNDILSFTLEKVECSFDLKPQTPGNSCSYFRGNEGYTYVTLVGTVENHSKEIIRLSDTLNPENILTFFADGETSISRAHWCCGEDSLSLTLQPEEKETLYIFGSVKDETLKDLETLTINMGLPDDLSTAMESFIGEKQFYWEKADHLYSIDIEIPHE